ncbi:phosphotransferase inositol or phosphatidylinositol kinase [Chlorella sorokiniana]|uniref:Phosphotransferase inositol or phosphatidylinositol kinase n=1 Tax=Chlorella sorokiniana TaxID=3076 RepID=A0A2P6TDL3_CHLSO|nr:phosphotransferase inositol or phosphatidylinositol kinase [Chlorella sorokiniana]|eukprot:PRW20721.1 phosphotransferase inositol or phosphatidylinositol kinase [Chlorella sorokiniana]
MQTVPDVFATRRELLIALRNIMATPFRSGLLDKMDVLLDEQVLLGKRIAHDCTIPAVLQSTSLRLLYNLIETIFQRRADMGRSEQYRCLLSTVLECFVRKLGALRRQVPSILRELEGSKGNSVVDDPHLVSDDSQDPFPVLLPALSTAAKDKEVCEFRSLLQTVFSCLKSVLYCMVAFHTNRGLQAPLSFPVKIWSVHAGDVRVVSRLITFGLPALAFYEALPHPSVDMREQFADLFTVLQEELAAELCLLAPARLEHLIPPMPRMMHAVLRALRGSDQSVAVALKVLDLWVDSFNPEFIERSMAGVIRDLMLALWAHIQPHPNPHGTKVAEIMGKLGGRSRQWLLDGLVNDYKPIPEYGLRVILAFSPRTSFLVPLDRCVQFAAAAIKQAVKVAPLEAGSAGWSSQLGVKTKKQHTAEQQAVFVVLRTLPEHASEGEELTSVLRGVLQRCIEASGPATLEAEDAACAGHQTPPGGDHSEQAAVHLPQLLKQLMEIFVQHMLSSRSSMAVRTAASAGLQAIADGRSCTVATLLKPISKALDSILDRRLQPIRSIAAQTNHAHSVAFILRTCSDGLALRPEPVLYIADACAIMEMNDAAISTSATYRGAPVRTEAIVRLRAACLQVLSAAIGWKAFRESESTPANSDAPTAVGEAVADGAVKLGKLREKLLKVLIMELGSTHDVTAEVAKSGVLLALEHNMLPKSILQEALRPILTDLAFYNRIHLRLLRHLHRLLDLLSGQFNVTLGDKLAEHLKKWIDVANVLQPPQPVAWAPGTEWEVAAGMLDIFHKLPGAAKKFLESQGKCVAYFLESPSRLAKDAYFSRLLDIIRRPEGAELLNALAGAPAQLEAVLSAASEPGSDAEAAAAAQLNCIHLIHIMAKLLPAWLPEPLFSAALRHWRSKDFQSRLTAATFQALPQRLESKWLAKIMLRYIERHHAAFDALFDLAAVFSGPMAVDFTFLKMFISDIVAKQFTADEKRQLLKHWLEVYRMKQLDQEHTVSVLRYLINPVMAWVVTHGELEVLSPDVVQGLVNDVFQNPEKDGPSEQIQLELVQLCATLIQHAHSLFHEHRKELIQFGWSVHIFDRGFAALN